MSISSDGVLAFGWDLGEERPWPKHADDEYEDSEGWMEWLLGLTYENSSYEERQAAVRGFPIEIESHCSYEYPMYFAAVPGTVRRARRGYPTKFELPEVSEEEIRELKAFILDYFNIVVEDEKVGWHLFSMYG